MKRKNIGFWYFTLVFLIALLGKCTGLMAQDTKMPINLGGIVLGNEFNTTSTKIYFEEVECITYCVADKYNKITKIILAPMRAVTYAESHIILKGVSESLALGMVPHIHDSIAISYEYLDYKIKIIARKRNTYELYLTIEVSKL